MQDISAAILSGGLGTRLRPLTNNCAKVMVEVNGKPFICYLLEMLKNRGIRHIVMCIGYMGDQIQTYLGNGSRLGMEIEYSKDNPHGSDAAFGTANAIKTALPLLGEYFFVINGDTYIDIDYGAVKEYYDSNQINNLMVVWKNQNRFWPSNVALSTLGDKIAYYSKSKNEQGMRLDYIDTGVALLKAKTLELCDASDLSVLYSLLAYDGSLAAYEVSQPFYEINSMDSLERTKKALRAYHNAAVF